MVAPLDTAPQEFDVDVQSADGATVVVVRGEIDLAVERPFRAALTTAVTSAAAVVVDLCACGFMDSRGLVALLEAQRGARHQRAPFVVACTPGGACSRLLAMALDGAFELFDDRELALAAVRSAQHG